MTNQYPLVSVIVPTYKRSDKIERALTSIFQQSYRNIEVIVVDDNQPDSEYRRKTKELIASTFGKERILLVETTGATGGGAARNYAAGFASGEYLAFLDDDDEYKPGKIEDQLLFMISNGLEMSYQDVEWYNEEGKLAERRVLDHAKSFDKKGLLRAHLLTPISPTAIYMIKKTLFDRTEGFGEVKTGQDWFLMLRCIEANGKIGYMPGSYVKQYLHKGERLSTGQNKIDGEELRHSVVKQYYPMLKKRDIRYIEFRHNAVLGFSCLRSGRKIDSVSYFAKAFCSSPVSSFLEAKKFFTNGRSTQSASKE